MLILFVMGILIVGAVLMTNILSIFFPFFQQLGSITNYNRSYYGAISGVERGLLVLKNHEPGFEGSGGWNKQTTFGPASDSSNKSAFGIISRPNNSMNWDIKSRTTSKTIPISGESNIDSDYIKGNEGYNKLTYANPRGVSLFGNSLSNLERIYLYYDDTTKVHPNNLDLYYTGVKSDSIKQLNPSEVKIDISRPTINNAAGEESFDVLNTSVDDTSAGIVSDIDGDGTKDDALISRSIAGKDSNNENFSIKQIQNFSQADGSPDYKINIGDTAIRESDINLMSNGLEKIIFGNGDYKSIFPKTDTRVWNIDSPKYHNINPVNGEFSGSNFNEIFTKAKNLTLNLGLINIPQDTNGKIYPFLRYKVLFPIDSSIPNSYYYIKGSSNAGAHDVQILVKKPVSDASIFSDFSIIF